MNRYLILRIKNQDRFYKKKQKKKKSRLKNQTKYVPIESDNKI